MANNFCSNCGEPVSEPDANVCTNCGKPLRQPQTESTPNESYQNTAGGSFQQSGSSNAQQSGSSNTQQSGSSNAQQSGSSNAQQSGSSNAQQSGNSDDRQTWSDNSQQTWNEQNSRNGQQTNGGNKNSYTRPENVTYVNDVNPIIPVLLSVFFPGSGQIYNGNLKKGLMIAASAVITLLIFPLISFIIWIYNLYDAYTEADKMRKGELPYAKATQNDVLYYIAVFIGSFIIGAILSAIFNIILGLIFMPFMF